jgi:hypothetical protein
VRSDPAGSAPARLGAGARVRRYLPALLAGCLASAAIAAGCGDDDGSQVVSPSEAVTRASDAAATAEVLAPGASPAQLEDFVDSELHPSLAEAIFRLGGGGDSAGKDLEQAMNRLNEATTPGLGGNPALLAKTEGQAQLSDVGDLSGTYISENC